MINFQIGEASAQCFPRCGVCCSQFYKGFDCTTSPSPNSSHSHGIPPQISAHLANILSMLSAVQGKKSISFNLFQIEINGIFLNSKVDGIKAVNISSFKYSAFFYFSLSTGKVVSNTLHWWHFKKFTNRQQSVYQRHSRSLLLIKMKRFLQWMAVVIGIISVEASTRLSDLNSLQDELEHLIGHQTQGINHLNNLEQRADELDTKRLGLSQFEESLTTRTKDLERKIQHLHSKQLQLLARNLNQVIKLELLSRESEDVIPSYSANSTISTSSMENLLQGLIVIEEAKLELRQWIQTVVEAKIQKARVAKAEAQLDRLKAKKLSKIQKMAKKEKLKCLTPSEGAQLVQQTLVEHRSSGPPNHLATATVIHEYTSDTYSPPPASDDLLGNVWWRKFIPEDWEKKLLPEGWEKWNVALPSAFSRFVVSDSFSISCLSIALSLYLIFPRVPQ
jgi:hypothetical protein